MSHQSPAVLYLAPSHLILAGVYTAGGWHSGPGISCNLHCQPGHEDQCSWAAQRDLQQCPRLQLFKFYIALKERR